MSQADQENAQSARLGAALWSAHGVAVAEWQPNTPHVRDAAQVRISKRALDGSLITSVDQIEPGSSVLVVASGSPSRWASFSVSDASHFEHYCLVDIADAFQIGSFSIGELTIITIINRPVNGHGRESYFPIEIGNGYRVTVPANKQIAVRRVSVTGTGVLNVLGALDIF